MSRLIDADELIKKGYVLTRNFQQDEKTRVMEYKKIEDVPTVDAEPIVRCKDCVYWQAELCSFLPDWHYCAMNNTDFRANDYCSRGEQKGVEE